MTEPKRDEIDHYGIYSKVMTLEARFGDFVQESREHRDKTDEKLDTISKRLGSGEVMFSQVMSRIDDLTGKAELARASREKIRTDVDALKTESSVHKGERGAWATIINSKPLAWLAATCAAMWAFLTQTGGLK